MPTEPAVDQPLHPLAQMTTYELSGYRRQLESAIAFLEAKQPAAPVRADLQARLDTVLAEQESRAGIRESK
jgi:hypothetical protein